MGGAKRVGARRTLDQKRGPPPCGDSAAACTAPVSVLQRRFSSKSAAQARSGHLAMADGIDAVFKTFAPVLFTPQTVALASSYR